MNIIIFVWIKHFVQLAPKAFCLDFKPLLSLSVLCVFFNNSHRISEKATASVLLLAVSEEQREKQSQILCSLVVNTILWETVTLPKAHTGFELGSPMSQIGEAILLPLALISSSSRLPDLIFYDWSSLPFLISLYRLKIIRELSCYLWKPKTYSLLNKVLAKNKITLAN